MKKVKTKIICNTCGGTRLLFDAYVKWDFEAQEYAVTMVADKPVICEDARRCTACTTKEMYCEETKEKTDGLAHRDH